MIVLLTPRCHEVEAILTMKAQQNNKPLTLSLSLSALAGELPVTDMETSPIHVMDLARSAVAGRGPSTLLCHPITLF